MIHKVTVMSKLWSILGLNPMVKSQSTIISRIYLIEWSLTSIFKSKQTVRRWNKSVSTLKITTRLWQLEIIIGKCGDSKRAHSNRFQLHRRYLKTTTTRIIYGLMMRSWRPPLLKRKYSLLREQILNSTLKTLSILWLGMRKSIFWGLHALENSQKGFS